MEGLFFVILLLMGSIGPLSAGKNPFFMGYNTVTTNAGTIKGTKENITAFGKTYEYFVYRGIRYAKDTSGANRFKKPMPMEKFQSVYEALEYTNSCPQPPFGWASFNVTADPMFHTRTGEDCLSLNVFTPTDKGTKKAVMVWIHGGGWVVGSGHAYFGGLLAPFGDVVYVSVNFRLGPFGFLDTGDSNCPGNMAYFDQLLALNWVKNNIGGFGGDPDQVTIFGESAGGFDVSAHAISPLSAGKGLFKRVISQSGSAITPKENPLSPAVDTRPDTKNLGYNLRCNDTKNPKLSDSKALLECLRKKSADDLLKYADIFGMLPKDAVVKGSAKFSPNVDGEFFPEHPSNLVNNPKLVTYKAFKDVDFIASFTSNDGEIIFTSFTPLLQSADIKPPFLIPKEYMHETFLPACYPPKTAPGVAKAVGHEYIVDADIANSSLLRRDAFIEAQTDQVFLTAGVSAAQTHEAMKGNGKTWMLFFDHNAKLFPTKYGPGEATHGADIIYCFGVVAMGDSIVRLYGAAGQLMAYLVTKTDLDLAKAAMTYFTNFAKYG
jgi:carboxylesterase type B